MPINETGVDYFAGGSAIAIGTQNQSLNLVNLGILGLTDGDGAPVTGFSTSLTRNDTEDNNLNVGETFTVTRTPTPTNVLGTPQTLQLTMVGSGTFSEPLIGSRQIIIGETAGGDRYVIFPNGDAPTGLDGVTGTVLATFSTDAVGYSFDTNAPLCFTRGTMIETPEGLRAIEDLRAGDLVLTRDNGAQPIRWIGKRLLSAAALQNNPDMRPIRIRAGALGQNTPAADLVVSPQHRVLVRSKVAQKMFGTTEVLVAAKQLLQIEGIDICTEAEGVEYVHMLFDRHEVVFANGAEAESLYTGPEAIKSVGAAALAEIYGIFPELRDRDYAPQGARMLLSGRMGRKLASRHLQHQKPLVAAV